MSPTPEPHVWSPEEMDKNSKDEKWIVIGTMGVYVDDLLLVAPDNILEEALNAFKEKFTLATPEWVTMENTVTFCGYDISKTDKGFALGQEKYIRAHNKDATYNVSQTVGVMSRLLHKRPGYIVEIGQQ